MTDVELRLVADVDNAVKGIGSLSKEYQGLVNQLAKPLKQVNAFRELESSLEGTERQTRSARDRVRELGDELARTAEPSKQLTAQYRDAVNELRRLERAEGTAQQRLAQRRRELQAAGVDTRDLVAEQRRLSQALQGTLAAGRNEQAVSGIRAQSAALAQLVREQRAASLEAARQNLGVNRYRELQAEIGQVRVQYQLLRTSGKLTTQELAIAQRSMTERVRETQRALREMNAEQRRASGISQLGGGIGGAIGAIGAGYAAVSTISYVSRTADAYNLMNARLRLATASQEEFNVAQRELSRIAEATEAPIQSLVTLYGRISRPLREAGRSQADILRLTEAVSTSFRVSGATAQEAENGVIQFAQALGAGALRGEEFNSVAEQAPRLMQALADGIGVPVGALKEMAAQGELTAAVVTDALTGQLETLRAEAETLPDTVGGAMTRLRDVMNEAVGGTDVQPLIDQIKRLSEAASDPAVQGVVQGITGWLVKVAAEIPGLLADFARLGPQFAAVFAAATGNITELDKIDARIKMLRQSLEAPIITDDIYNFLTGTSEEDVRAELDMLTKARAKLIEDQTGLNEEMQFLADVAAAATEQSRARDIADYAKYIGDLEVLRKSQIKAAQDGAKALVAAEKKATADLQKVRDDRLKIEQRYQEALAGLGGTGEASYSSAQNLKIGARNALANGDVEGAQRLAQEALKMLQDLAAAGENTYGFRGFIQELQQIELAANDLEQSNAEDKLKSIQDEMQRLKDKAKELEGLPVSVKTDDATIEQVRTTIEELVAQLSQKEVVIPVRVVSPDGPIIKDLVAPQDTVIRDLQVPQFAGGGYTGPGGRLEPAGVVHRGEVVWSQLDVARAGGVAVVEAMRRGMRGYDMGGIVAPRAMPAIPSLAPALQQQLSDQASPGESWTLNFPGGESVTTVVPASQQPSMRRLRLKFGGS
ncbi:phage tail protein [Pseudomonas sp. o96-267]|uniref:tape measure protein n=1 Tax=Pseudomonas sp. o96-267 TaxID=2479853 RepID=UPI000F7B1DC5|nr:tape measure protein [Pseudomonas sp. o96-267]RRV41273.1 phage tail protein [Pseudomonas sp. o96-267]